MTTPFGNDRTPIDIRSFPSASHVCQAAPKRRITPLLVGLLSKSAIARNGSDYVISARTIFIPNKVL